MMKAAIFTAYGSPDVLQIQHVAKPTPKDNELLIRIHATTATMGDCEIRSLTFPLWLMIPIRLWIGVFKPRKKVLGQELAGEVEAVGKAVTLFKAGDPVFASVGMHLGTYAEYTILPEKPEDAFVALKPQNMTYAEAAAVPFGAPIAWDFLRKANIKAGQKVLINGAGGSIGTFAIQMAKAFGADVTSVDSGDKLAMLREIGSDHVIDYKQADFTRNGQTYDVIFDVAGKCSFSRGLQSLTPDGYFLLANPPLSHMLRAAWSSKKISQHVVIGTESVITPEAIASIKALIESGKLKTVIDRRFPLEQVAEAHRYVESGRKQGNVVIEVTPAT